MQKILVAINAFDVNTSVIDFAAYIAKLTRSKVTAVFLKPHALAGSVVAGDYDESGGEDGFSDKTTNTVTRAIIERNIHLFQDACTVRSVNYSVHHCNGEPAEEIIKESRFADLIIAD